MNLTKFYKKLIFYNIVRYPQFELYHHYLYIYFAYIFAETQLKDFLGQKQNNIQLSFQLSLIQILTEISPMLVVDKILCFFFCHSKKLCKLLLIKYHIDSVT